MPAQYRRADYPDEKAKAKNVSLPTSLIARINEQARSEGHNNFSTIIVKAVIAYLKRWNDEQEAA